ncbi:MAG: SUMF1/EgtB/PvdO family nonheme iron enzyme [Acidobacteriota bacterium]
MSLRIFISYSHKDTTHREQLETHLAPLRRRHDLIAWSDQRIEPGERWDRAIAENLDAAHIILLLISADFLASEYCYDKEMQRALAREAAGKAIVLPIIVRPCYWEDSEFAALQALPDKGQPIVTWAHADEAYTRVVRGIGRAIQRHRAQTPSTPAGRTAAPAAPVAPPARAPHQPEPGEEWINEKDGSVLVYVPGGRYNLGADYIDDDSRPVHTVTLSPYRIGKYPVTNAQYRRFLEATGHREPEYWDSTKYNADQQPVVGVSWHDARAYCAWAGLRLPSEAQWEAAARGKDQRVYPWGSAQPSEQHANFDDIVERPTPVGSYPLGAGPFGTLDQAGNVWEWCADVWSSDAYSNRDGTKNPLHTEGDSAVRLVRGGAWNGRAELLRAAYRFRVEAVDRHVHVGFRVSGFLPEHV